MAVSTKVIGAERAARAGRARRLGILMVGLALAVAIGILAIQVRSIWITGPAVEHRAPVQAELVRPRGRTVLAAPNTHPGLVRFAVRPKASAAHRRKWGR